VTSLYDTMKASGLPESEWPVRWSKSEDVTAASGWDWLLDQVDVARMNRPICYGITEQQAADLCECALRRAIRAAMKGKSHVGLSIHDERGRYLAMVMHSDHGVDKIHADALADSELSALAALHAKLKGAADAE